MLQLQDGDEQDLGLGQEQLQDSLAFMCIKEPRHEFFSSLKRKKRVFRLCRERMEYLDEKMNLKGEISVSAVEKVVIHSIKDIEIFSRNRIHWLQITSEEDIRKIIN